MKKTLTRSISSNEVRRRKEDRKRYIKLLLNTCEIILVTCAVCILVCALWLPVLKIQQTDGTAGLQAGELAVAWRSGRPERDDLVAFYSEGRLLIRRVAGVPGDWVSTDPEGGLWINDTLIDQNASSTAGRVDPAQDRSYQIPDDHWFVLSDNSENPIDSRTELIGLVRKEQIFAKLICRIWPLDSLRLF